MKLPYALFVVALVILNSFEITFCFYGTYLPPMYRTVIPGLRNVTVYEGFDYAEEPILQLHWIEFLDDYIPERLQYPSFYRDEGEDLIMRVIAFNGNLYHLMGKVKLREKAVLEYAFSMKKQNGPYFLKVDNNYEDMMLFYNWTIPDCQELEKYVNDTAILWGEFNTLLETIDYVPDIVYNDK